MTVHGSAHEEHAEHWAETVACRVVAAHSFGAFAAVEVVAPAIAAAAAPGQFVMVTVPAEGFFLRRPLSLFTVRDDRVGLLVEERGPGSRELARVAVGETLEMAGPLGTPFPVEGVTSGLLVGGGIGCAPLQYLADELRRRGALVTAAFGFRDLRQARAAAAFDIERLWLATEDGSVGRPGTVVDLLAGVDAAPNTVVYTCGPLAMVAAVQRWAHEARLGGYASLEAHMACGTGSCHGCVVATTEGYLRVCSEGPVFALDTVVAP
ncbi:MAG: NAD-dependent dihydroorotate dehydrogenase B electron transfer subunit [Thermoleophilia bacterium]|jgi:dihydroorotate dehydrogenase electron transfer subunit|nr:NAD-dependent dihydroorotate dehydrogenase B electron transfer subunit [Thermoleophilia bacterium]